MTDKVTTLHYTGDRRLTGDQEAFLKEIAEVCARYRVVMDGDVGGVCFAQLDSDNCPQVPFYVNADVTYHGDCVDDFNLMGQLMDSTKPLSLDYQLDVVAIGNYEVAPHAH
jgi:hypothetical protein